MATYVSEDQALARARAELVEFRDVLRELERNPLPASIDAVYRLDVNEYQGSSTLQLVIEHVAPLPPMLVIEIALVHSAS